nr:MAG TPA: hypothetical protein [Caudoviricetes sp.]
MRACINLYALIFFWLFMKMIHYIRDKKYYIYRR